MSARHCGVAAGLAKLSPPHLDFAVSEGWARSLPHGNYCEGEKSLVLFP